MKDLYVDSRNNKEYKEEFLWYIEFIVEYFVFLSRKSKLEIIYRNREDISILIVEVVEDLFDFVRGLCISNSNIYRIYFVVGIFIDGYFVEMFVVINEDIDFVGILLCFLLEDNKYLDDIYLLELIYFYEVDID